MYLRTRHVVSRGKSAIVHGLIVIAVFWSNLHDPAEASEDPTLVRIRFRGRINGCLQRVFLTIRF